MRIITIIFIMLKISIIPVKGQSQKKNVKEGLFLVEGYWNENEQTYRQFLIPLELSKAFNKKTKFECFATGKMDWYTADTCLLSNGLLLVEILSDLAFGNKSKKNIEPKSITINNVKYYFAYLKFEYIKGDKTKLLFPKLDSNKKFVKFIRRKMRINYIRNVLDIKWI